MAASQVPIATFDEENGFDLQRFQAVLQTQELGRSFIYRRLTTSTIDIAKRERIEGAPSGTTVLAEEQSAAVANKANRTWSSKPRGNIYTTYLVRRLDRTDYMSFMATLAVTAACEVTGITKEARVKWPNDVWFHGKKLSGCLVLGDEVYERSEAGDVYRHYVYSVGIGINVHEDMSRNENLAASAISLDQIAGKRVDREAFLAVYFLEVEKLLALSKEEVFDIYRRSSIFQPGAAVLVHTKGVDVDEGKPAVVIGMNSSFQLLVEQDGEERTLVAEEVSVRLV